MVLDQLSRIPCMTTHLRCHSSSVQRDVPITLASRARMGVEHAVCSVAKMSCSYHPGERTVGRKMGTDRRTFENYIRAAYADNHTTIKKHHAHTRLEGALDRKLWLIGTRGSPKGQIEDLRTKESCLLIANTTPFLPSQQKVLINSCLETKQQRLPHSLSPISSSSARARTVWLQFYPMISPRPVTQASTLLFFFCSTFNSRARLM
jgi:hypothetical protein